MDAEKKSKIIENTNRTINDYNTGALEAAMGYRFQTRAFLEVIFLYINSVDVRNPDILGTTNKNTFVYEAQAIIEKIKEQSRLDIKDLNFEVSGASTLGRFIPKAANRKMLQDNNFATDMDEVVDNAVDFGSGFLKVWKVNGIMKMRSVDPFAMIFNQYNFKGGLKIERLRKTAREIIADEKYDAGERAILKGKTKEDDLDKDFVIFQVVQDFPNGSQELSIVDTENDLVYFNHKDDEPIVSYYKFDIKKRKGFPDALGVGYNERIFNKLVQSKVARERMDAVMEVASKLPFQKQMDNERDNYAGKEVVKLKTSAIIGHKGNKIEPLDTGGVKQANLLTAQLNGLLATIPNDLNVGEALLGNTLPSGTSGALGNLLTENSSSVLKENKKNYAKFLDMVYADRLNAYLLDVFDKAEDLKKFLDPNDIKLIQQNVINYLVAQKQIDAAINEEPFDITIATEEVKRDIKGKPLISGDLLDKLREEVQGIRTFISGETVSKAASVAFIREIRNLYATKPELFKSPFFIETLKKEAEYESGISGLEIDNLLKEIQ